MKYRIHTLLWSEPLSVSTRRPTVLCLPFLSACGSSGSPFLVYFLSGSPSCVSPGAASSLPQVLVASSTLRCDYATAGAWRSCLHKGTGALGFGFFTQKLSGFKYLLFWPYNLSYETSISVLCLLHSKYLLSSAFHKCTESAFCERCLCLRTGSFTGYLRKLSSYSEQWYFSSPKRFSCWKKRGECLH